MFEYRTIEQNVCNCKKTIDVVVLFSRILMGIFQCVFMFYSPNNYSINQGNSVIRK